MSTLKKAWYRTFQFVFSLAEVFLPQHSPELLKGAGSVKKLPEFIKAKGVDKVLIVTDGILPKLGLLDGLFAACDEAKLPYVLYDGAEVNPSIECIEAALKTYVDNKCQAFIAFGGGSSMDCAKAAAARAAKPKRSIKQLGGTLKVHTKIPLLFAVPTTAGTGSEATLAAVVTDYSTHHKYAIQDPCLLPKYAVLDPELTVGLPPHVTSTTGMDALTHAVEAYTNKFAPKYTQRLSEEATKLIFENLEKAYADGKNIEARSNMLLASFYAGRAFSRACVGNVHAIAHTLGGLYGTAHGLANAVILPYVMEDFGPAVYYKLARLAEIVGIDGADDGEKARAFILEIRRMNRDMNIPEKLDFIKDEDIPQMCEWATKEANPIYPVPVIWDGEQFAGTISRLRTQTVAASAKQRPKKRRQMEERYLRSLGALSEAELELLRAKRVCVVGCGGIGGYVIELLARAGIGALTVVDGDSFAVSNLNRQLLATEELIGESKARAALERVRSINSAVRADMVEAYITEENADGILKGHDLVIDALDSIPARRILAGGCKRLGLTLVHGAISGWCAQAAVITPDSDGFDSIYSGEGSGKPPLSLSFTPALVASVQTAEAIKILVGREPSLKGRLLLVDLLTQEYNTISL